MQRYTNLMHAKNIPDFIITRYTNLMHAKNIPDFIII